MAVAPSSAAYLLRQASPQYPLLRTGVPHAVRDVPAAGGHGRRRGQGAVHRHRGHLPAAATGADSGAVRQAWGLFVQGAAWACALLGSCLASTCASPA